MNLGLAWPSQGLRTCKLGEDGGHLRVALTCVTFPVRLV